MIIKYKKKKPANLLVVSVIDEVSKMWTGLMTTPNLETYVRELTGVVNAEKPNMFNVNDKDQLLYILGEFDAVSGKLIEKKQLVVRLSDLRNVK